MFEGFDRLQDDYRGHRGMDRAWLITMLMFVGGYVLALWGILACMNGDYPVVLD